MKLIARELLDAGQSAVRADHPKPIDVDPTDRVGMNLRERNVEDGRRGAFEIHEADVVEQAGAMLLNATREALAVVSAYYQRLAEQTRGHGITAEGAAEEIIPADRGLPGHGGPLLLPD